MKSPTVYPLPSSDKHPRNILVVEDNVTLRYTLSEWLRMKGYVIIEAATADEAMDILHSLMVVDLVITDVHMPGSMNGIELAYEIRKTFDKIKVIVVSGEADRLHISNDTVFFRKPYDLNEVTDCIERMLPEAESIYPRQAE